MKHYGKRFLAAAAALAIAAMILGGLVTQQARAAFDEDLPSPLPGPGACIEKQVSCRLMATYPDGSTRAVYGTKTCFTGSIWYCPPCGPCEIDDFPL
jgi:hypothetical protein